VAPLDRETEVLRRPKVVLRRREKESCSKEQLRLDFGDYKIDVVERGQSVIGLQGSISLLRTPIMGDTVSTLLFQPPAPSKLKEHKIVWLNTSRGSQIPAFFISYKTQRGAESCRSLSADELRDSQPENGITLLYSHANAEDLGSIYPWCKFLSKMLQVNIFAYDYTGYGMSHNQGPPSEKHCYADIESAYAFLRKDLRIPAQNIVLYGRSLGSGPSCHLAAQTALLHKENAEYGAHDGPVGGLILHAPFLSVFRVVADTGCTVYGDKFPNVDVLPMVKTPTILVHGTSDQIVPFHHSERLYDAIPLIYRAKPLYIEGMSHNNVHAQVRSMFVERLSEYLDDLVRPHVMAKRCPLARLSISQNHILKVVNKSEDDT
jgi:pimeloyl-ACP methyl ester carboxylesterase